MATEYTVNNIGDKHEICRNGELVATYDAVKETTTYAGDGKKYAVPISKEIVVIKGPPPEIVKAEPPSDKKDAKINTLAAHVTSLQLEVEDLKRQLAGGGKAPRVRDRYAGIPIDHPDAPEKDKFLGMYTPAYIEWARGFWTPEQFTKIYKDKYPATEATIEEITK